MYIFIFLENVWYKVYSQGFIIIQISETKIRKKTCFLS